MTLQIDKIEIIRFRGLRQLCLNDLQRINFFVGHNNCGKTSALEAVQTFCQPFNLLKWIGTARRREARFGMFERPGQTLDFVRWLFPQFGTEGEDLLSSIKISGEGEYTLRSLTVSYSELLGERKRVRLGVEPGEPRRGADLTIRAVLSDSEEEQVEHLQVWDDELFLQPAKLRQPFCKVVMLAPYSH